MARKIDTFDEEDHLMPSTVGIDARAITDEHHQGQESWASSRSPSTLVEDATSLIGQNGSQSSLDLTESSPSSNSDRRAAPNHGKLRPLYAAGHQSSLDDSSHRALEVKLTLRSRKGHRKSRQGCYNCKRRKIKVGNLSALLELLIITKTFPVSGDFTSM